MDIETIGLICLICFSTIGCGIIAHLCAKEDQRRKRAAQDFWQRFEDGEDQYTSGDHIARN